MTMTEVLALIETTEEITVTVKGTDIYLTIEDFKGFDSHWSEIIVDTDEADAIIETLEESATEVEHGWHTILYFTDCAVSIAYASEDI